MFKKFALLPMLLIPTSAQAQEWVDGFYAEIYGGVTLQDNLYWHTPTFDMGFDLDAGSAFGASLGLETGVEGLAVELDVLRSSALYSGTSNALNTITLMGNVQYTAKLTDGFGVYGGAGLGAVFLNYDNVDNAFDSNGTALGYQAFAGMIFDVTDNISLFGEYRFQAAFDDITVTNNVPATYTIEYNRHAVMAGLRVSR